MDVLDYWEYIQDVILIEGLFGFVVQVELPEQYLYTNRLTEGPHQ